MVTILSRYFLLFLATLGFNVYTGPLGAMHDAHQRLKKRSAAASSQISNLKAAQKNEQEEIAKLGLSNAFSEHRLKDLKKTLELEEAELKLRKVRAEAQELSDKDRIDSIKFLLKFMILPLIYINYAMIKSTMNLNVGSSYLLVYAIIVAFDLLYFYCDIPQVIAQGLASVLPSHASSKKQQNLINLPNAQLGALGGNSSADQEQRIEELLKNPALQDIFAAFSPPGQMSQPKKD